MQELTTDTLHQFISEHSKVLVQYGATWCGNCRMIKPKVKKLADAYPAVSFVYVDAEKLPESRKLAQVDNLPTFAGFVDGKLVSQVQGNKIEIVEELVNEITGH